MDTVSRSQLIISLLMSVLPWALFGLIHVSDPSWYEPFFAWSGAVVLLPLMVVWSIVGFVVMLRARSTGSSIAAITVFVFPLVLMVWLGGTVNKIINEINALPPEEISLTDRQTPKIAFFLPVHQDMNRSTTGHG